MLEWRGWSEQK